ncbi:MAG: hypothetical protein ACK4ZW_05945 [Blastomonas sp.]
MTTRIGGIVVDIDARLAKLEKELAKGNRDLQRFEKNAIASGGRVEQGLMSVSRGVGTVVGALGGLGIALGVSELAGFAKSALDMGDNLVTAADQAMIGVERFQTLRQAFRELEIDGDAFDKAMLRLATTLGDVQSGAIDASTKALDKMGITARVLSGEIDTTDELLDAIAASASKFGTEAEFTSSVVDIFGRRVGVQMAAALRDGGKALHDIEADVKAFGTVLTEQQINKLADANETIERWQEVASYRFAIFAADAIDYFGQAGQAAERFFGIMGGRGGLSAAMADLVFGAKVKANPNDAKDVSSRLGFSAGRIKFDTPNVPVSRPRAGGGGGGGASRRSGGGGGAREADSFARSMADLARRTADARMEFTALNEQWDDVTIMDAKMRAEALRIEQEQGTKWTDLQRSQWRAAAEDLRSLAVRTKIAEINQRSFNDTLTEVDLSEFSSLPKLEADLEKIAARLPDLRSRWQQAMASLGDAEGIAFDGLTRNIEGTLLGFQSLSDAAENFSKQLLSMALQAFVFAPLGKALKIPGYADGTSSAPGGLALVGERGPELVNLPRGSQVVPNNRLMNMASPLVAGVGMGGGAPVVNQTINFSGGVDLATRTEVMRMADATKRATLAAMADGRRRSAR